MEQDDTFTQAFLGLVSGLYQTAMVQLGKIVNPATGKVEEVQLEAARTTIEVLRMLREKTRGNLNDEERRTLEAAITNAELNFADEARGKRADGKA